MADTTEYGEKKVTRMKTERERECVLGGWRKRGGRGVAEPRSVLVHLDGQTLGLKVQLLKKEKKK